MVRELVAVDPILGPEITAFLILAAALLATS